MKNTAANRFCRLASGISLLLLAGCVTTGADVQEAGDDAPVGVQEAASLPREAPETVALWLKALRAWAEGPPAETPEIAMAAEVPAGIPEAGPVPGEQNAPPTLAASAETPISAAAAEVPAGIPEAGPVPGEQDAPPTLAASAEMPISAAAAEVPAGIPEAGPVPREQDAPSTLAAAPVVKTPVEKSRKGARKAKPRKPTMAEMEAELARLTREINDAIHDR
ncbi:MAG: hypothetical protein LBO00_00570, partial [Zoogloeaceae bacterium]|nr:hypothetical protein [Zoogloeaceae bacterium]